MTPNTMNPELRAEAQRVFSLNFFSQMPLEVEVDLVEGETTLAELVAHYRQSHAADSKPWAFAERSVALDYLELAVRRDPELAGLALMNRTITYDTEGMRARTFMNAARDRVYFIYAGTNRGQWLDNGVAMNGMTQNNRYRSYDSDGEVIEEYLVEEQASQGQAEALDYFHKMSARLNLDESVHVTVSGHSKGGNVAQFVALNEPLVDRCFSIDGQGFSPEHMIELRNRFPDDFGERVDKLIALQAQDDYVNVLGVNMILAKNRYYFSRMYTPHEMDEPRSFKFIVEELLKQHSMLAMCDEKGLLSAESSQGGTPDLVKAHSKQLMNVPASERGALIVGMMAFISDLFGFGQGNIYADEPESFVAREQIAVLNMPTVRAVLFPETLPKSPEQFTPEDLSQANAEFVRRLPSDWYRQPVSFGAALLAMSAVVIALEGALRVHPEEEILQFLQLTFLTLTSMIAYSEREYPGVKRFCDFCKQMVHSLLQST